MVTARRDHWEKAWQDRDATTTSWFQDLPVQSLALMDAIGTQPSDPIIDIGGGQSRLVLALVQRGHHDVSVLDIAQSALTGLDVDLTATLGRHRVTMITSDILDWQPGRMYAVWHDRAVNHFLTSPTDRAAYVELARRAIRAGGHLILASFAPDGPDKCSGLTVHRSDADSLAAEFSEHFDLVSVHHEVHQTPWQAAQSFHYLVLKRR